MLDPRLTKETVRVALLTLGGIATCYEVCEELDAFSSWERETVLAILSRAFLKVPITQIDREYRTGNKTSVRWAYKVTDVPVQIK